MSLKDRIRSRVGRWLRDVTHVLIPSLANIEPMVRGIENRLLSLESNTKAELAFNLHDLSERFGAIENELSERFQRLDDRLQRLDDKVITRLNTIEYEVLRGLAHDLHQVAALELEQIAGKRDGLLWNADPDEHYLPAEAEPFSVYLDKARQQYPKVFEFWRERLDRMSEAFDTTKTGNAANAADIYSRAFHSFVEIHAKGRVLDVGCGVFGCPFYLQGYPTSLISGLEPLLLKDKVDFEVVRGVAEYLPWPDQSFSTVISGTSLDHTLSLERSLAEVTRVLTPNGRFLLWIGSNPGSPRYTPDDPNFTPSDHFHLFHFDAAWFDPMLEESFDILERLELKVIGYSHVFYALKLKN